MFITDLILGTLAKVNGAVGQAFFIAGIISAIFGQSVLTLRHLRLSVSHRLHALRTISVDRFRRLAIYAFSTFLMVETLVLLIGLDIRSLDSFPFVAFYIFISLVSITACCVYAFSKNQLNSRLLAVTGILLLAISDAFIGLGISFLAHSPYIDLIVWSLYGPVLLLMGASIIRTPVAGQSAAAVQAG